MQTAIPVPPPTDARRQLRIYLDEFEGVPAPNGSLSLFRRIAGLAVPPNRRFRVRRSITRLLVPEQRLRATMLLRRGRLRLHLGCGKVRKEGWVNVDLATHPVDLAWDLTRRLPFPPGSIDAIFYEFCLEHLTPQEVLSLHEDCFRVLRPGGVLRGASWDAKSFLTTVVQAPESILSDRPQWPTAMLAVNRMLYYRGLEPHSVWDAQTLTLVFAAAGFARPEERRFGDSSLKPCPDTEARKHQAIYVEAVK